MSRIFSKTQFGKETVRGTAVAADTLILGATPKEVPQDRDPVYPEDALGVRSRSSRSLLYNYLAEDSIEIPHGYFNILPMILSCGVKGNITAVEQTASQSDYLWDFTPSQTATNAPDTITLEVGDDIDAYEVEYVMFAKISMKGVVAQGREESPVSITVDYFGRQVTKTTFTGSITAPSPENMNGKLSRLYADATWANRGNTELTGVLRGWELELITGLHPKGYGSANRYFDSHGEGFIDAMLTLTLEGNATADAEYDKFRARTAQALQLVVNGSQIGSGDTYQFKVSVWGDYQQFLPMSEESVGNNLSKAVFHGLYGITGAQQLEVTTTVNANSF